MDLEHQGISGTLETLRGETLKTGAEFVLSKLSKVELGSMAIEAVASDEGYYADRWDLRTEAGGISFRNPLIVGAGWDKKGRCVDGLWDLGFAGVEVGSVLVHPQAGNPKPRLWALTPNHSIGLNRLGFNSPGMLAVRERLEEQRYPQVPVGISLGMNKLTNSTHAPEAHAQVAEYLHDFANYFTVNVSSPNTPGLRELQDKKPLKEILLATKESAKETPVWIKVAPELSNGQMSDVIEVAIETGAVGIITANTTTNEKIKQKYGVGHEMGGLSGSDPDYQDATTQMVKFVYEEAGDQLDVIGVGGVNSGRQVALKMMAGASAVQLVTAIREHGPKVANRINRELLGIKREIGVFDVKDLIGVDTKRGQKT